MSIKGNSFSGRRATGVVLRASGTGEGITWNECKGRNRRGDRSVYCVVDRRCGKQQVPHRAVMAADCVVVTAMMTAVVMTVVMTDAAG